MSYDRNGPFGSVRIGYTPEHMELHSVLGSVTMSGWHRCNELYHVERKALDLEEYVLLLTLEGTGELVIAGRRYVLTGRTLAIAPMNRAHTYYTKAGCEWEFLWLHIRCEHCARLLEYMIAHFGWTFEVPHYAEARQLLEGLLTTQLRGQEYEVFAAAEASRLMYLLMQYRFDQARRLDDRKALVYRVMELMEPQLFGDISVQDIAKSMFVSSEHIIRVFRAEMGQTPYQYIKQRRMAHACRLLCNTTLSVREVARSVGYGSVSAFIHQFRGTHGATPAQYRENMSQN